MSTIDNLISGRNNRVISGEEFFTAAERITKSVNTYATLLHDFDFENIITFSRGGLPLATYVAGGIGIPSNCVHVLGSNIFKMEDSQKDALTVMCRKQSTIIVDDILDTSATIDSFFGDIGLPILDSKCKFVFGSIKDSATISTDATERHLLIKNIIIDRTIGLDFTIRIEASKWAVFPWENVF